VNCGSCFDQILPRSAVLIQSQVEFIFNRNKRWLTHIAATVNALRLCEIARVLVRFDHVASFIVNADHSMM
jgi:hypothetical protein